MPLVCTLAQIQGVAMAQLAQSSASPHMCIFWADEGKADMGHVCVNAYI